MKKVIIIFVSFIVLSCNNENKPISGGIQKGNFKNFLKQHQQDFEKYKKIMIIPGSGCTSCITDAETYYTKNYLDNFTLYIFTAIGDVKILKMKFAEDQINRKNILIDKENEMADIGFTSIYPSFAEISDSEELVKISNFSQ
jgi:hypothetical protein